MAQPLSYIYQIKYFFIMTTENTNAFIQQFLKDKEGTDAYVIVLLSTNWSGAASLMRPIFNGTKESLQQDIYFLEINVEEESKFKSLLQINTIPTILIFHQFKLIDRIEGMISKKNFQSKIDQLKSNKTDSS